MLDSSIKQRTIKHPVSCFGVGIHSGKATSLTLYPAPENSGITFIRSDIKDRNNKIQALYDRVSRTTLGTTIENVEGVDISIIEHLMAALWGCKIDNVSIELDGPEIPIMDGSAESFVFLLECAGFETQNENRKYIELLKSVSITDGDSSISMSPADYFSSETSIDFNHKLISHQKYSFSEKDQSFKHHLCRARTFGFERDSEMLKKAGLAKGASLDNAVVVGEEAVLNEGGLRYRDEFVRHKLLDMIGDLYLAGFPIKAHVSSYKPGHTINNKLLRKLFSEKDSFRIAS